MRLVRLTEDHVFKPFDCGEEDLNEFLLLDAKDYLHRLMSVTYIIENDERTVAFFSVSNDRVAISDTDKATWRRIKKLFPHTKHRSAIPFYMRNGFVVLDKRLLEDESQETCPLYYNLFELIK